VPAKEAIVTITDLSTDMIRRNYPEEQAAVKRRLDEIWAAAAARDFRTLESFHVYGPKFTSFKNGAPREDAAANAAGERVMFSALEGPEVDMRDLAVNVFGSLAIATFNGHFTGMMNGSAADLSQQATMVFLQSGDGWKLVHEHFSPLTANPAT
jgi:ketosteroid isomerase-like protein